MDVFLAGIMPSVVALLAAITLWVRSKIVERKLDENTKVTAETKKAAAESKSAADNLAEHLNGRLDEKIVAVVRSQLEPVIAIFQAHTEQDDKNMKEIRQALGELRDQVKTKSQDRK